MDTIVFLVGKFFPQQSSNGAVVATLAQSLAESGRKVIVVSESPVVATDREFSGYVCRYVRTRSSRRSRLSLRQQSRNGTKALVRTVMEIARNTSIRTVICVHRPQSTAYAGILLEKYLPDVGVQYLLLDFALETLPENPILASIRKLQYTSLYRRMSKGRGRVIVPPFLECAFAEFARREAVDKATGIGLPLLKKIESKAEQASPKTTIDLLFAGGFLPRWRKPTVMLEAISACIERDDRIRLHLYSYGCEEEVAEYCRQFPGRIVAHGLVPQDKVSEVLLSADILINVANSLSHGIPGKIFEYFSSGLPLLTFASGSGDPARPYLNRYPLSKSVVGEGKELVTECLSFISSFTGERLSFESVCGIFPEHTPSRVSEALLAVK